MRQARRRRALQGRLKLQANAEAPLGSPVALAVELCCLQAVKLAPSLSHSAFRKRVTCEAGTTPHSCARASGIAGECRGASWWPINAITGADSLCKPACRADAAAHAASYDMHDTASWTAGLAKLLTCATTQGGHCTAYYAQSKLPCERSRLMRQGVYKSEV